MKNNMKPVIMYKIVLLGDEVVGKTSLWNRYTQVGYQDHQPTLGVLNCCLKI
ncbi:MAG: hypothetical protein ACE5OZ_24835 [Candidatus Heimdallarchaeota archaeon]